MASRTEPGALAKSRTKYPWHDWTDGSTWRIVRGEDYRISTYNMQISLHGRARTQELRVRSNSFTERLSDERGYYHNIEGLIFRFYEEEQ